MAKLKNLVPCLWFDGQGEEAAAFYVGVFPNSRITAVTRYGKEAGPKAGTALTVAFELDGHAFTALNGGPEFKFTEALSFQVLCETQADVDYFWDKLKVGGPEQAQQCGWVKDRFGLCWQIVPTVLPELLGGSDPVKSGRAMQAMLKMKKLDIAELKRAYAGS